jgi:hypothetical protein
MNKKKNSFKNRIKDFYESENAREGRFNVDDEFSVSRDENMDLELLEGDLGFEGLEGDIQDLENPEDQSDTA